MGSSKNSIICALDTTSLDDAIYTVARLKDHVGAFKIGHGLTLSHGLDVVGRLQDVGADRIFLDLKFHDIPNSVGLAVRRASQLGVWMLTLHIAGGPAMMAASVEEAKSVGEENRPLLVGVSVLTSIDQHTLTDHLGVPRTIHDHMVALSKLAVEVGLDGVVCSPLEVAALRRELGPSAVLVTPGIRPADGKTHDQVRVGSAEQALADGSSYLVIGRAITEAEDPHGALAAMGLG